LVYSPNAPPSGTAERELFDGKDYLRNNMTATAKDVLLRATEKDPSLAEAHFWLSGAHRAAGDGVAAERSLQRAYQLDPSLRAHQAELDRFGPRTLQSAKPAPKAGAHDCQALYTSCMVTATRCSIDKGCQTDFSRQASCTVERNLCRARNGG
jgi:hypothetical protein